MKIVNLNEKKIWKTICLFRTKNDDDEIYVKWRIKKNKMIESFFLTGSNAQYPKLFPELNILKSHQLFQNKKIFCDTLLQIRFFLFPKLQQQKGFHFFII